ncbi:ribosomal protein L7/L12 [Streptomyces sp. NPDC046985]|uniref:ribosomal protein L7/L12 n=1 Tax=Streptomyces sp. NPDC046985 TaxID=3155377 RepID=UPI0033DCAEBC
MDITLFLVGVIGVGAVFVVAGGLESRFSRVDRRLARVEGKLDLILDHLGLREDEPWRDEVVELVRAGRKIEAIKVYRKATGAGLPEAKDAVERIAT